MIETGEFPRSAAKGRTLLSSSSLTHRTWSLCAVCSIRYPDIIVIESAFSSRC
jgi:hypothetical protein